MAPNARAARISGTAFAVAGAVGVVVGVASILVGSPSAAHDLAPLAGPADVVNRFGQMAPVLAAAIAAIVVLAVAALLAAGRLEPPAAAVELLILGLAIDACIGGALGRVGHAADGGVMGSTVTCLMGGAAVLAGGIIAAFGRE
ncbi:MAG: hypothetical protein ABSB75_00795 [Candidatus Limnocylindrales bacterium]